MSRRQMAFGAVCFLIGILVGLGIAGSLDALVRLVILVLILLLCVYLLRPYFLQKTSTRRSPAQRTSQRRVQRKP